MVSVRKSRRTGAGRLVACQASATQDCGQTPWAQLVDSESLGDAQKARIPRRAACPASPACTAPPGTNCGLSGRHATYSGLIRGSLAHCKVKQVIPARRGLPRPYPRSCLRVWQSLSSTLVSRCRKQLLRRQPLGVCGPKYRRDPGGMCLPQRCRTE